MSDAPFGALLDRLLANSTDLVWIAAADGSELYFMNRVAEAWLGISSVEATLDPADFLGAVHPHDREARASFFDELAAAAADESVDPHETEFRLIDSDGQVRWVHERVFPIPGASPVSYWGGIARDVTERRDAQETRRVQAQQFKLLNQIIRHDIRNEINLGIDLLRTIRRDPSAAETELEQLWDVLDRVVELTETSRDMTEVIGEFAGEPVPVDLKPCLKREIATASTLDASATVSVDGEIPDVTVRTTELLAAVFRNLLKNAVQHGTEEGSTIEVRVDELDDHVVVHISDEGPGIPDTHKERVFESGETLSGDGTGFGLSLAETLLAQYGGGIYLTDNEPSGATFSVSVPIAA